MAAILFHDFTIDDAISPASCYRQSRGFSVEAQREAVRRYLVRSGKRSNRPQLAAAMALAKKRIADMPGANRLTLHVLAAAAEHERHMIGERTRHALAAAKARAIKLGNPKQAEINLARAAEQAQALRPHLERCIEAGRTSSSAIAADLNARGIAAPNGG
jgi:hypothetical protein